MLLTMIYISKFNNCQSSKVIEIKILQIETFTKWIVLK